MVSGWRRLWDTTPYRLGRRWAAFVANVGAFGLVTAVSSSGSSGLGADPEMAVFLLAFGYVVVVDLIPTAVSGGTIGHHVFGLRVERAEGGPPGWRRATARALAAAATGVAVLGLAAMPAVVFASFGQPLVSEPIQVLEAISGFEAPLSTLAVALLPALAPLVILPGATGWHELVSGTAVRPRGGVGREHGSDRGRLPLLIATVAIAAILNAVPAAAVAQRLGSLDGCLVEGERRDPDAAFEVQRPSGVTALIAQRPPPPGTVADPWWIFAPHDRRDVPFSDGTTGTRIASATPRPGEPSGSEGTVETSFGAGGVRWRVVSSGTAATVARHDDVTACVQSKIAGLEP